MNKEELSIMVVEAEEILLKVGVSKNDYFN